MTDLGLYNIQRCHIFPYKVVTLFFYKNFGYE